MFPQRDKTITSSTDNPVMSEFTAEHTNIGAGTLSSAVRSSTVNSATPDKDRCDGWAVGVTALPAAVALIVVPLEVVPPVVVLEKKRP